MQRGIIIFFCWAIGLSGQTIQDTSPRTLVNAPYAKLTPMPDGTVLYCTDCTAANPTAAGGPGAVVKREHGVWNGGGGAGGTGTGPMPSFLIFPTQQVPFSYLDNNYSGTMGFSFHVTHPVDVVGLSRLYMNGNSQDHFVGLWNGDTHTLLASGTVLNATPTDGWGFKDVAVSRVTLVPGVKYRLATTEHSGGDFYKVDWLMAGVTPVIVPGVEVSGNPDSEPTGEGAAGYCLSAVAMTLIDTSMGAVGATGDVQTTTGIGIFTGSGFFNFTKDPAFSSNLLTLKGSLRQISPPGLGVFKKLIEPNAAQLSNQHVGEWSDVRISGLDNPTNYGNSWGFGKQVNIYNGRNSYDNSDKKTQIGEGLTAIFSGGGQRFGRGTGVFCFGSGDCGGADITVYTGEFKTAAGDEATIGESIRIFSTMSELFTPINVSKKSTCNTTTTAAIPKSNDAPDVKVVPVVSVAGCNVGDWLTFEGAAVGSDVNAEVVKLTAVGPGNTITALFQQCHGYQETWCATPKPDPSVPVTPSNMLVLNYMESYQAYDSRLGQDRVAIITDGPGYSTGSVASINTDSYGHVNGTGTSWSNTMVGGDAINPGCIAFTYDVQSRWPFDGPTVAITAITSASQAVITAAAHGLAIGVERIITVAGVAGTGWTGINRAWVMTVLDADHLRIKFDSSALAPPTADSADYRGMRIDKGNAVAWFRIQSVSSPTNLIAYGYDAVTTKITTSDYLIKPCGRIGMLDMNITPTDMTISQVVIFNNNFNWDVGKTFDQSISPGTIVQHSQMTYCAMYLMGDCGINFEAVNEGYYRSNGAAFSANGAAMANYWNLPAWRTGLSLGANFSDFGIVVGGKIDTGVAMSLGNSLDRHSIAWGGLPNGGAEIYPTDQGFVINQVYVPRLLLKSESLSPFPFTIDYSKAINRTVDFPNVSGTILVSPGGRMSRSLAAPIGSTVDIGKFTGLGNSEVIAEVWTTMCAQPKRYIVPGTAYSTGYVPPDGQFLTVLPLSWEGDPVANDCGYDLDVRVFADVNGNYMTLRLRKTSGASTTYGTIIAHFYGDWNDGSFTESTTAGTATAPPGNISATTLTQHDNKVIIPGLACPAGQTAPVTVNERGELVRGACA